MKLLDSPIEGALAYTKYKSPVGELWLCSDDHALIAICWQRDGLPPQADHLPSHPFLKEVTRQLDEYFAHLRRQFDLPLRPHGTSFQRRVWQELCEIPYGQTISYQQQAIRVGNAKAMRAVGAANGRNPIPIIIPCHRVIGKDGSLTGFAAGLTMKQALLAQENTYKSAKTAA